MKFVMTLARFGVAYALRSPGEHLFKFCQLLPGLLCARSQMAGVYRSPPIPSFIQLDIGPGTSSADPI